MATNGPIHSGMPASELGSEGWHKPWSGTNGGSCVEAKRLPDGSVAFRQSKDPDGPALVYSGRDGVVPGGRQVRPGRLPDRLT